MHAMISSARRARQRSWRGKSSTTPPRLESRGSSSERWRQATPHPSRIDHAGRHRGFKPSAHPPLHRSSESDFRAPRPRVIWKGFPKPFACSEQWKKFGEVVAVRQAETPATLTPRSSAGVASVECPEARSPKPQSPLDSPNVSPGYHFVIDAFYAVH